MSENKCSYRIAYEKQKKRAERAEAERDAAQSTIADLTGQVGRMREAIECAPHSMGCGYAWVEQTQPGCSVSRQDERLCDCWKRAALGDAS